MFPLLGSLECVTYISPFLSQESPIVIDCPIEPSFLAIGPSHLAVGMNNRVWFTNFTDLNSKSK